MWFVSAFDAGEEGLDEQQTELERVQIDNLRVTCCWLRGVFFSAFQWRSLADEGLNPVSGLRVTRYSTYIKHSS